MTIAPPERPRARTARPRTRTGTAPLALLVASAAVLGSYGFTRWLSAAGTGMLPWILGRGLGIAGYLALAAVTMLGLWLRHPWRLRRPRVTPVAHLRLHSGLAAATVVLIVGHIVALLLDRYAGVGVAGTFVPGRSGYRPAAVALGTLGLYTFLLVGGTAALAGRLRLRAWLPIHRLSYACFALVWLHGVLAGSDTKVMTVLYAVTGAGVIGLAVTKRVAAR